MDIIIRRGRVFDPARKLDMVADLGIENGTIVGVAAALPQKAKREIDALGLLVLPGFIDMHVHLREPGREEAETIESGTWAAAAGGFTAVACMPNTKPVNDCAQVTGLIRDRARQVSPIPVFPIGAITLGSRGETLAPIEEMVKAGIVGISDDGQPVQNNRLMRQAMEKAREFDVPVIDHCEDKDLAAGGCMHEGDVSAALGLRGIPAAAEEIQVSRDAILAAVTGARVHIAHLSTGKALEIVKAAKEKGVAITCEATPHHLLLGEEEIRTLGTHAKMNPPLRTAADREALIGGLANGWIDVIATDHAPHTQLDKSLAFDRAPFGVVGLETAVSLILDRLVRHGLLTLERMVEVFSLNPARMLKLKRGLGPGDPADITIIDPNRHVEVRAGDFRSRSRNTPFEGWKLQGSAVATVVGGKVVWDSRRLSETDSLPI